MSLYPSLYAGVVTDNKDPKKIGRVKLKVGALGEEFETNWAWPISLMAGNQSGTFWPPTTESTAFCMFLNGDPEHPVYMGGVWSAPAGQPETPEEFQRDDPDNRGFKTPAGQTMEFDDNDDSKGIRITSISGHTFVFDDREGEEAIFIISKQGAQIQLNKDGNVQMVSKDGAFFALDAKNEVVTIGSKDGTIVALSKDVTIVDSSGKSTLTMSADSMQMTSDKKVIVSAPAVTIQAGTVNVGDGADMSVAMAEKLADLFDQHIHATVLGPSGPPLPPNTAALTNLIPTKSFKSGAVKVKNGNPGT